MFKKINQHYDVISLALALILLLIALMQPSIEVERDIKSYMIFVDVTQSMNVQDMVLNGQSVSRIEYSKQILKETIEALPCGSRVGLGIFYKFTATALYAPIETCANYDVLLSSISHLEWRMASLGSSNIRAGLQSIASLLVTNGEPAQVTFITDGNEAAPLNIFTKTSLVGWQSGRDWLLVGVGGNKPTPIPKLNARNEVIGYWSTYSVKLQPASNVDENGGRDESVASQPYEYYLSQLDEPYMKELAQDIGGQYLKMGKSQDLIQAMLNQVPALHAASKFELHWIFALGAMLIILSAYLSDALNKATKFTKRNNKHKSSIN
ncbi:MAG: VWA domain-containing protein [Methylotenera sp.]|nr:VWA domain-containing protein [Methylotenera sp.]